MIFALAGNPNSGKTTLFNQLTGSNQHVGNFPGVTVDKKEGIIKGGSSTIVDLPGIYSLSPYTNEEVVTRDFLINHKPDCIINIVDATNLERNLYLSLQLKELDIPVVIALNMMDEVRANGNLIDVDRLQELLGVQVLPISATKNEGINELIELAITASASKEKPKNLDLCTGEIYRAIHSIEYLIQDHTQRMGIPLKFAATKLIEGDEPMTEILNLTYDEKEVIKQTVIKMEEHLKTDREAALADMRYTFIEEVCKKAVKKQEESKVHQRSLKADSILTHKYLAIPIFLTLMLTTFYLTFGVIGVYLSDLLSVIIEWLTRITDNALTAFGINQIVHSLVIDGIFVGVGSVLSFLPIIVVLFFFLSMLEDSGYMARVAFITDKLLRKIGLSGRSVVPMIIGFGCSVPAIMATRTLASERDRKMTILLIPFMSCSAKIPIYSMFTIVFFPKYRGLVFLSLYMLGIIIGIISGCILQETVFKGKPVPFVMELPNYRFPSMKSVVLLMWDKAKDFLTKAFTIIFLGTIVIWFLQKFDLRLMLVENSADSILAHLGMILAPVFKPIGFGDWRSATALVTGFTAKEAVVSTLAVLTGSSISNLHQTLGDMFTPLQAYSFLTFTLLYTPCGATVAAIRKEMGSLRSTLFVVAFQLIIAWVAAFIVYNVGSVFI